MDKFYFQKLKNAKSDRTLRRVEQNYYQEKLENNEKAFDILSNSSSFDSTNDFSDNLEYDIEVKEQTDTNLNFLEFDNQSEISKSNVKEDDLNEIDQNRKSNDCQDKLISELIMNFKLQFNINNQATDSLLKLINNIAHLKGHENIVPNSLYLLKQDFELVDNLNFKIGFDCLLCKNEVLITENDQNCPNCNEELNKRSILNGDHFIQYDLEQQLSLLLNNKPIALRQSSSEEFISSIFDGEVYKDYINLKNESNIILLTLFSDGVRIFKSSSNEIWPIFIKVHNIIGGEVDKVFLSSNFYGGTKPNVDFYLEQLISSFNNMFENGIYIDQIKTRVYPMLILNVFDLPAKSLYMNHVSHIGYYFCTFCFIKGKICFSFFNLI